MSKNWESLAVAVLLSSSSMNAQAVENNNRDDNGNRDRIEVVQDNTRETLREDSAITWEEVRI